MLVRTSTTPCLLPYPEKFIAAVEFVRAPPPGADALSNEKQLMLYALEQQATEGPCNHSKPWGWNVVESAKHEAWSSLKDMPGMEAMRHFVQALEEDQRDWWALGEAQRKEQADAESAQAQAQAQAQPGQEASADGSAGPAPSDQGQQEAAEPPSEGSWQIGSTQGKSPAPRYEHAVAAMEGSMFVVAGNCGGRYLNDVWALHVDRLAWELVSAGGRAAAEEAAQEATPDAPEREGLLASNVLPPCAGHALIPWGSHLLCIGGHVKALKGRRGKVPEAPLAVYVLDRGMLTWARMRPQGDVPPSRGGHTATKIGSKIFVFGGEDAARRPTADLFVLDMADSSWSRAEASGQGPPARSAHTACSLAGRYLLIFGGGSIAHCYGDLWMLDTQSMQWSQPEASGTPPAPRAGHASAVLQNRWYILGGGNNARGCTDMVSLDLTPLVSSRSPADQQALHWEEVASSSPRDSVASEGLSLLAVPSQGCLLAFGGYNGRYHSNVQLFRPGGPAIPPDPPEPVEASSAAPAAVPQQQQQPEEQPPGQEASHPDAVQAPSALETPALANGTSHVAENGHHAPLKAEKGMSRVSSLGVEGSRIAALETELEAARREVAAAKESAAMEVVVLRHQLAGVQQALSEAEQARDEAKEALSSQEASQFKLQVELAEAQKAAAGIADLEKELARYRKMEQEYNQTKGKGGSSLWGYISGAPS